MDVKELYRVLGAMMNQVPASSNYPVYSGIDEGEGIGCVTIDYTAKNADSEYLKCVALRG